MEKNKEIKSDNASAELAEADDFWHKHVKIITPDPKLAEILHIRLRESLSSPFEVGFDYLLGFKEAYGHVDVPGRYKSPNGFKLGSWVSHQRVNKKNNRLPAERVKRLDDIGFIWDPLEQAFKEGYSHLLEFKEANGHVDVPGRYKSPNGFKLGIWVSHQRVNKKNNRLPAERVKRLDDIGFIWDPLVLNTQK